MKHLICILTLFAVTTSFVVGQETSTADTLEKKVAPRPHIIYFEAMGRGGYWNIGYGYSFFQRDKHELNALIGMSYLRGSDHAQLTPIPVGVFYRYGHKFKLEVGFSVTPVINWQRFRGRYYDTGEGYRAKAIDHSLGLIPSIGFVYGAKNKKFEVGIRYTPLFDSRSFSDGVQINQNTGPYWFGAFFYYRIKGKKEKTTANTR